MAKTKRKKLKKRADASPLQHATFECAVCLEACDSSIGVTILEDKVCTACFTEGIIPQFLAAEKSGSQYPVKWGGQEVKINAYRSWFSKAFLEQWDYKQREYDMPAAERLYCHGSNATIQSCGRFLGSRHKHRSLKWCFKCGCFTCWNCDTVTDNADDFTKHSCEAAWRSKAKDPFEGLECGKHFQRCPSCKTAIELRDGCNHITCRMGKCSSHFCFLCGVEAIHQRGGHWDGGPCPLYGRPEDVNNPFAIRPPIPNHAQAPEPGARPQQRQRNQVDVGVQAAVLPEAQLVEARAQYRRTIAERGREWVGRQRGGYVFAYLLIGICLAFACGFSLLIRGSGWAQQI